MKEEITINVFSPENEEKIYKPKHREDLQWLRAIAITSVVIFHLNPKYLFHGYLGVDMFFVISGYLMTKILNYSDTKRLSINILSVFYIRRIKRIFPIYLFTVLITVIFCSIFTIKWDYDLIKKDVLYSISFTTNIQTIYENENYFSQLNQFKFLLHTWSLSVEIQYYLISPFLLYFIYKIINKLSITVILILLSWLFQMYTVNHTVAFNFLFSRVWQFLIGTFVYYDCNRKHRDFNYPENERLSKIVLYFTTMLTLILFLCLPELTQKYEFTVFMRSIVTILTGILIYLGNFIEIKNNSNLLLNSMSYIGDISYSIYLLHWPIIVYAKYSLIFDYYNILVYISIILILSILQYKYIELKIIKQSTLTTSLIIIFLYCSIIFCIIQPQGFGLYNNSATSTAVKTNQNLLKECTEQLNNLRHNCIMDPPFEFAKKHMPLDSYVCSYKGNGTGKILITGNSYAMRQVYGLIKELNGKYDQIYIAAQSMCTVFLKLNPPGFACSFVLSRLMELMKLIEPDVMIVTQRLSTDTPMNSYLNSSEDAKNDNITQVFREYWREYSNLTKQIIIIEPHPTFYDTPKASLVKLIRENQDLSDYYISEDDWDKEVNPGWWRTVESTDSCDICSIIPIKKYFCHKNKKCDIYDENTKSTLYCDAGHFTSEGAKRIMPDVVKAISTKLVY